jgi:hypothetical protein
MLLGTVYHSVTSYYISVVPMGRISNFSKSLLVFGVLLVVLAGFSDGNDIPVGFWGRYGNYILLIGGAVSILMAIVLMLGERKQSDS